MPTVDEKKPGDQNSLPHLGSSEHCARMLNDALPKDSTKTDLDSIALKTVEQRLANSQLIPGIGHGIHTAGDPRAERLFEVAQETEVYGSYCELLRKIGKIADQKVGKHLPVNVTGAIAAISLDMGIHWQMSKSFAILGRALGGLAHVGEEIRRSIARGISNLIRDNLQYEPKK
ncbi:MAG: citrate/2-methylcitrate synthase [Candidatus Binatia bacterium]